jgi:hypothetical protein
MTSIRYGVAALALMVGVSARADGTPPSGTLSCGTTGTATLQPGIPGAGQAPSSGLISFKIKNAGIGPCDNSGLVGGKAPVNTGGVRLNAKLAPGANCATLLGSAPNVARAVLKVKLQNTDFTIGQTITVAVIKPTNLQWTQVGTGFHVTGTIPQTPANNKPFGGEAFEAQLNIDNIEFDGVNACAAPGSTTPLTHLEFSAVGSGFSIHP